MRIVFVTNRYFPAVGGAEIVQKRLAEGLVGRGHAVTVLATDFADSHGHNKIQPKHETIDGVAVVRFSGFRLAKDPFTVAFGMFGWLKDNKDAFDVIVAFTYGYPTTWLTAMLKMLGSLQKPLVVQPHYGPISSIPGIFVSIFDETLGRLTISNADKLILLTPQFKDFFMKLGAKEDAIAVVPPIVPAIAGLNDERQMHLRTKYNIPDGKVIFLSLCRLVEYKGVHLIVDGLEKLKTLAPEVLDNVHLVAAGDGDFLPVLKEQVEKKGMESHVTITGMVSDEERNILYNLADVFVLLSYSGESFGVTLVEAMSAGLPVIGSDRGAIPSVIDDGKTGKIVNPFDAKQVADAMKFFLSGENRETYSANARESSKNYGEKEVLDQYESLLSSVSPVAHQE